MQLHVLCVGGLAQVWRQHLRIVLPCLLQATCTSSRDILQMQLNMSVHVLVACAPWQLASTCRASFVGRDVCSDAAWPAEVTWTATKQIWRW